MHKALMQFQINYLEQCSFWHPVLLWLTFSGSISSVSFPVVCVPARMEHTWKWFYHMLFMALSLPFLHLKLFLHLFCLNNIVFLPQHWFPLLFLAYSSLLCSVLTSVISFFSIFTSLFFWGSGLHSSKCESWTEKS